MVQHTPVKRFLLPVLFLLALCLVAATAIADQSKNNEIVIRDTEIEDMLKEWSTPVIKAAGLVPENIRFVLVQNDDINAFVAGGPNIFIYTGLLTRSQGPDEVIGVIAHELGHISGGHLLRTREAFENASYESLLGMVLGIGAALVTGQSGAAAAISSGSRQIAERHFLSFSRVQESSADQAALTFMNRAHMSPAGLVRFMHELESQELLPVSQQSEYVRTHPIARNRIDALQVGLEHSEYANAPLPEQWKEQHRRMLAKLIAFISPEQVDWKYDTKDKSIAARYARTVAAYQKNHVEEALKDVDDLLTSESDNPYFLELKGQMLVDFGRVGESLPYYKKAIAKHPDGGLIRAAYGRALIESTDQNKPEILKEAITQLERAARDEPRTPSTHRMLATAYGRLGNTPMAHLHLAEEALLKRQKDFAKEQAEMAAQGLEKNSRAWIRANDILNFINTLKDDKG